MREDVVYLRQMELGPMQNFVYLIGDPETRECVAVDPAWEIDAILEQVRADGMRLTGVLITHTHQDHVGGQLFGHDIPGIEDLLAKAPGTGLLHNRFGHSPPVLYLTRLWGAQYADAASEVGSAASVRASRVSGGSGRSRRCKSCIRFNATGFRAHAPEQVRGSGSVLPCLLKGV
jgi:hypothetical protein